VQGSVDALWSFTGEMFMADDTDRACAQAGLLPDLTDVRSAWMSRVERCLSQATLSTPEEGWMHRGGKKGIHSEHLSYMLAEMQVLPRTYPNASW